ncbi:3269_t:CDS:1, partial [Entrophospora sp. SA101]
MVWNIKQTNNSCQMVDTKLRKSKLLIPRDPTRGEFYLNGIGHFSHQRK